tara:strand:+ start:74 stop:616 length:543 start_codon:yes stop_codon:yes gene_type:complete
MADQNKKKLKVKWYDALNPLKMVGGAVNVYKQEIKKKRNNKNKSTKNNNNRPNPKQDEINKVNKNIKNAKGWNKEQLEKKKKHLEKFGKSKTWSNPYGAEGGGKPSTVDTSKTKTKKKRLTAREKLKAKNVARHGEAHVNKLQAKQGDFKKMRSGKMSKADFIKKYPKSITAQKAKGLRK